jgi:hypothetical protein
MFALAFTACDNPLDGPSGPGPGPYGPYGPLPGPGTGTEADPIALTAGVWAPGSVPLGSSVVWYSFNVTGGVMYYIWWNDEDDGDGTKTGDVVVSAYYSNGIPFFTEEDSGWSTPEYFTPTTSGTVKIKVVPYGGSYPTGTFAIAYSTSNTRPSPGIGPGSGDMTWTDVANHPFGEYPIVDIAYGDGKFVAVGMGGKMAYSTNGANWIAVADSTFGINTINAIAYGSGKFVAGGGGDQIAYSSDGGTWVASSFNYSGTINSIAYGSAGNAGGRFVAGGDSGTIAYSDDGISWTWIDEDYTFWEYTNNSGNPDTANITSVAYGGGRFVAGGAGGKMAYSADGISWTAVSNSTIWQYTISGNTYTADIPAIAYSGNRFVAGGGAGKMAYSADGISWTAEPNSPFYFDDILGMASYGLIRDIAYGNGRFVAVGGAVMGRVAYSADGITWTVSAASTFDTWLPIYAVAYGGGRFVVVAGMGLVNSKMAYADW